MPTRIPVMWIAKWSGRLAIWTHELLLGWSLLGVDKLDTWPRVFRYITSKEPRVILKYCKPSFGFYPLASQREYWKFEFQYFGMDWFKINPDLLCFIIKKYKEILCGSVVLLCFALFFKRDLILKGTGK